jgi:hypothetical protein
MIFIFPISSTLLTGLKLFSPLRYKVNYWYLNVFLKFKLFLVFYQFLTIVLDDGIRVLFSNDKLFEWTVLILKRSIFVNFIGK